MLFSGIALFTFHYECLAFPQKVFFIICNFLCSVMLRHSVALLQMITKVKYYVFLCVCISVDKLCAISRLIYSSFIPFKTNNKQMVAGVGVRLTFRPLLAQYHK